MRKTINLSFTDNRNKRTKTKEFDGILKIKSAKLFGNSTLVEVVSYSRGEREREKEFIVRKWPSQKRDRTLFIVRHFSCVCERETLELIKNTFFVCS